MKIFDLTPEAYGTLRALWTKNSIKHYEEKSAKELVKLGYAKLDKSKLRVTKDGMRVAELFKRPKKK
jgi:hypothetical protein